MTSTGAQPPARELLAQIRAEYPDTPFLALGQTVFWDEPVKAVLRRLLDENNLGGRMVLGVHDTDYFAKSNLRRQGPSRFALMPHNDGTTQSLWSAAGEVSALFGSETFPSRHDFVRFGVPFKRLAASETAGRQAFIDRVTEAWGWRGLVYTGSSDLIVNRLPLREVGDGILEMLTWGIENTIAQIVPGCCQDEAQRVADLVLGWCHEFQYQNPAESLTHLFQYVLPRLYTLLLGYEPSGIEVTCTTDLLRLTPETAGLPRFRLVDLFLNPGTRSLAEEAYNQTVAGTEIYTLDRFGAHALPFDCLVPERGRGTLRVTPRVLFIETRQPVAIALKKPIESVHELAEVLSAKFGNQVTLVGKAVSLVSMLAEEFLFVFNEGGSMYVRRTRRMNDMLRAQGVHLNLRPILRLRYRTWDALEVGCSTLRPTEHLARVFGQPVITSSEFAASWQLVLAEQRSLCDVISGMRKPLELLRFLMERDPSGPWEERLGAYLTSKNRLIELRRQALEIQEQTMRLYERLRALKARGLAVQQERGDHFRHVSDWTPSATARRAGFEAELVALEEQKSALQSEIALLRSQRLTMERGDEATEARVELMQIEIEAERARLLLVRNALLTIEGLEHTNHRPSAWWLPMVDPSGEWFRRMVETTEPYVEPLLTG